MPLFLTCNYQEMPLFPIQLYQKMQAAPITIRELTHYFDQLMINQEERMEHSENAMIDRITEVVTDGFAAFTNHINNVVQAVQNRAFGGGQQQQPQRVPHVNVPNAFPKPRGALGKIGFFLFLRERIPQLNQNQRNQIWRDTGDVMDETMDAMPNDVLTPEVERAFWRDLDHDVKDQILDGAFAALQEMHLEVAAEIEQCVDLWPLALCAQTEWTARSYYRR